jgi:hypothetical protein
MHCSGFEKKEPSSDSKEVRMCTQPILQNLSREPLIVIFPNWQGISSLNSILHAQMLRNWAEARIEVR